LRITTGEGHRFPSIDVVASRVFPNWPAAGFVGIRMTCIAIVGAGFSGTLLALHLLRRCPSSTRVRLIERNSQFGRGPAYSTGNASHLLNVPAGRMSAFHDRPSDFIDWLRAQPSLPAGVEPHERGFVPRQLFGAYIRHLLNQELKRPESQDRLELIRGDVIAVEETAAGLCLRIDRDRMISADMAVLATGNFPPEAPPVADRSFYETPFYRPDPWASESFAGIDPDRPVLLIGTGLTTVDAVVSLLDRGHRGPIHAISRRGLVPHRHSADPGGYPPAQSFPTTIAALARFLREESEKASAAGATWQPVIDQLRPFTQDVWAAMSLKDRARFLRHIRPWWEIHRHRLPPAVAARIDCVRASGQLRIDAGRIRAFRVDGDTVSVTYMPRRSQEPATLSVARVINCSGPGADYDRIAHPLFRKLLSDGLVCPDPLRLGLEVTGNCALKNRKGAISRRLFAVGPVTKAAFWEITAVPDIRRQCEFLAGHLSTLVKPAPRVEIPATTA
jgi:uncharacterized NAD(P)/FAD-binding protein YdhS